MSPSYENLGGHRQMMVTGHQDLLHLDQLDRARWAVTSAPLGDLHLDERLTGFLSRDYGPRLRAGDLLHARDWLLERLSGREGIDQASGELRLADLDGQSEAARVLGETARQVLVELGREGGESLSLEDLRSYRETFDRTLANGDGLVLPEEVDEPEVAAFAARVLATVGGRPDVSGAPGVGLKEVEAFRKGAERFLAWRAQPEQEPSIRPWGGQTAAAWKAFAAMREVVEDWFRRCDLLSQEGREPPALPEEEWRRLWSDADGAIDAHLAASPLARPCPEGTLALDAPVHPAYRQRFQELREQVLTRVLEGGERTLDRATWERVVETMKAHGDWKAARPAAPFHQVPEELLRAETREPLAARLESWIHEDQAATEELRRLEDLERLVLLQAWILELARNMVSFGAVYDLDSPALFQMGTLVIDGRRLRMTVRVLDRDDHRKVASLSKIFLVYAQVSDDHGKVAFEVAAPVTTGERGQLRVGKRGVFLDRDGEEWDAEIVAVVENPISLREAIQAPFQRFGAFLAARFEELASSRLAGAEKSLSEAATRGGSGAPVPATPAPAPAAAPEAPPPPRSSIQNLMLMGSLATAALGSAAAFLMKVVAETNPLRFFGSLLGLVGFVALTAGFLGWLRLRRRDMSLLLEANDWAVNVPMALSRSLGATFTLEPALPGEEKRGWGRWIVLLLVLLMLGYLWDEGRLRLGAWLSRRKAAVSAPAQPTGGKTP